MYYCVSYPDSLKWVLPTCDKMTVFLTGFLPAMASDYSSMTRASQELLGSNLLTMCSSALVYWQWAGLNFHSLLSTQHLIGACILTTKHDKCMYYGITGGTKLETYMVWSLCMNGLIFCTREMILAVKMLSIDSISQPWWKGYLVPWINVAFDWNAITRIINHIFIPKLADACHFLDAKRIDMRLSSCHDCWFLKGGNSKNWQQRLWTWLSKQTWCTKLNWWASNHRLRYRILYECLTEQ